MWAHCCVLAVRYLVCGVVFYLCAGRKRQRAAAAEEEQWGNADSPPRTQSHPLFTRYQRQHTSSVIVIVLVLYTFVLVVLNISRIIEKQTYLKHSEL